jgi:iron-sulfur cluster repair di-iron protein
MSTLVPELISHTGPTPTADSTQASRGEVLDALNELLEAERAGARVAMETARDIPPSALATLVQDIHKDEVRWCNMLLRTIKALEGTASSATGAFWGKAMAIPDLGQRLSFLNRGQAWVVRRLQALIPRVQDAQVRAELVAMLEAHHKNIERVDAQALEAEPVEPTEPTALIAHIVSRYHEVHRLQLPELVHMAARVEAVHRGHAEVPTGFTELLEAISAELLEHMAKEEAILFPMLARGGNPFVVHPIGVMQAEHVEHAERIAQLLAMTRAATPPSDACDTWRALYAGVRRFADDLANHMHLENDVLFPQFEARHA